MDELQGSDGVSVEALGACLNTPGESSVEKCNNLLRRSLSSADIPNSIE